MYRNPIKSIMENCVGVIKKDSTLSELANVISKNSNKIFAVINDSGKIVGIINCNQILIKILKKLNKKYDQDIMNKEVSSFMNKHVLTAFPGDDMLAIYDAMMNDRIEYIIIINEDHYPIGVLSIYSLIDSVVKIKLRNDSLSTSEIESKTSIEKDKVIQKLMKKIAALNEQSTIDPLTGLFNIRYFNKVIDEEVDRVKRYKYNISIIFMDLDHFKDINDRYGHDCGNMVLHEIGMILSNNFDNINMLRKSDIAIRYGGEEFVVICPNTKKEQAYILAERIRKTVEKKRFTYESNTINVTISIGIAEYDGSSNNHISDTIKNADTAMYDAKRLGRNRVIVF